MNTIYTAKLQSRIKNHLLRDLDNIHPSHPITPLDFTSNDYLGLSNHPAVKQAMISAIHQYGAGQTSSRVLFNNQKPYLDLEQNIADNLHQESALLFSSGYQANISVLGSLLNPKYLGAMPLVFCDKFNHASLHAGIQLAGVKQLRYRHLDLEYLDYLLNKYKNNNIPKFIISDSIFGMEGDCADIPGLIKLKNKYNCFLYIDEAHSIGILGKNGYGLCADYPESIDLIMGSFSKALGCFGGFVACNDLLKKILVNFCNGLIYTTALPIANIAAIHAAWQEIVYLDKTREHLKNLKYILLTELLKINTCSTDIPILSIIIGDNAEVLNYKEQLGKWGIAVSAIRPPTVPLNTARLRISLNATHTIENITQLTHIIKKHWTK